MAVITARSILITDTNAIGKFVFVAYDDQTGEFMFPGRNLPSFDDVYDAACEVGKILGFVSEDEERPVIVALRNLAQIDNDPSPEDFDETDPHDDGEPYMDDGYDDESAFRSAGWGCED